MKKILLTSALAAMLLAIAAPGASQDTPELDGHCAMSAAHGNKLPTDCSVVWISPKSGRLYCFSSENAKLAFIRNASANEDRAQAFWQDPAFWEKLQQERDSTPEG
jgi:hypothetical protein